MQKIHENLEYQAFDIPNGIVSATVCRSSGLRPVAGLCDGNLRTEYFAEGTVPSETCNVHYSGNVCVQTGLPATDLCPFKVPGVLALRPPEDPALRSGSGYHASQQSCPHDANFFADPNYHAILEQQAAELFQQGYVFSLDGY